MSRKKRKFEMNIPDVDKFTGNLKYKDLKRECVIRGMEFDQILNGSVLSLHSWLGNHFNDTIHYELLDAFDDYQEDLIKKAVNAKGQNPDDIIHPALRLGYIAERDDEGNVIKRKRARTIIKRKKHKRERKKFRLI